MQFSVLLIGLDNSGKTSLFIPYRQLSEQYTIRPTNNLELYMINNPNFQKPVLIYDCSGQFVFRDNWNKILNEVDSVIFVIDSIETDRFHLVQEAIQEIIQNNMEQVRVLPFVFLLNKQDRKDAMDKNQIIKLLNFDCLKSSFKFSKFIIKESSGIEQMGVLECLDWLNTNITQKGAKIF